MKFLYRILLWFKERNAHYLFPLLTFAAGWWLGMLTNPTIGAIFFSITVYLVLVIFIPWNRMKRKSTYLQYCLPLVLSVIITIPLWNNIVGIFPSPYKELIRTVSATVKVNVKSDETINTHSLDSGGALVFGMGTKALLITSATDCFIQQTGGGVVEYRGIFNMDASSETTKENIKYLRNTEYIQIEFGQIKENTQILGGEVIVIINNSFKLGFIIPSQKVINNVFFIRGIQTYLQDTIK